MNNDAIDRIFNAADSCSPDDLRGPIRKELERKDAAWARLVKATETLHIAAMMNAVAAAVDPRSLGPREDTASCRDAVAAARQALRDLGVDVDALLGEP
jgi:hypothetical protein